jgi:hypothetical protein
VWNGRGERLYAISFLPGPSNRVWSEEHNSNADIIMPFGAWHWGSDAILFLMEGQMEKQHGNWKELEI